MKTFVLLGCERREKLMWYNKEVHVTESKSRKCNCPYRLRGYPVKGGEWWVLKLCCEFHNHDLTNTIKEHNKKNVTIIK